MLGIISFESLPDSDSASFDLHKLALKICSIETSLINFFLLFDDQCLIVTSTGALGLDLELAAHFGPHQAVAAYAALVCSSEDG